MVYLAHDDRLYSGKGRGGGNFGEFGDLLRICQNFIHQLFVVSEEARGGG